MFRVKNMEWLPRSIICHLDGRRHKKLKKQNRMSKKVFCYTGSKSWSTYYDGYFVQKYSTKYKVVLNGRFPFDKREILLITDPAFFCAYANNLKYYKNKIVCWWHGDKFTPNKGVKQRISTAKKTLPKCTYVIVSCEQGYNSVLSLGVPEKRIIKIPLGVDLGLFKCLDKKKIRTKYGIPENAFCVGSFQRDTDKRGGPKIIKGPDIFVSVLKLLKDKIPNLFVLLSAIRRDYVCDCLRRYQIPYKHVKMDNYFDMPFLYNCLDVYLVTSRVEGGPKALVEAPACNIPVVSTNCGMAKDVIQNDINGFVCEIDDCDCLADKMVVVYNKLQQESIDLRSTVLSYDYATAIVPQYKKLFEMIR